MVLPIFSIFDPWLWVVMGVLLAAIEALLPGYVLLGFGLGAAAIALALFPLHDEARALPHGPVTLIAIWSAVSVLVWIALTSFFGTPSRRRRGERDLNDFDNSL